MLAFAYGQKPVIDRAANYNSACGAGDRRWFDGFEKRRPTVLLIGAVHGHETEGVAALINLIELMETGQDTAGNRFPGLQEVAERVRLVIVPVANPDGRARVKPAAMVGLTNDELRYWGQGTWKDGSLCGWPGCKQRHPIKAFAGFLGGYFNDDGINLMHDQFFRPFAKETQALLDLAEREQPGWIIQLHGGSNSVADLLQPAYVPVEINEAVRQLAIACDAEALRSHDFRFTVRDLPAKEQGGTPESFNLCSALHHVCGAVSCVYESNQRIVDDQGEHWSFDQIYQAHMLLFEQCMRMA